MSLSKMANPLAFEAFLAAEKARGPFTRGVEKNMLDQAREDAKAEGFQHGYRDGFSKGERDGFTSAQKAAQQQFDAEISAQINAFSQALQQIVDRFNQALPVFLDDAEEAMADRAMEVVTSLLSTELKTDRSSVYAIVREVLGEITLARHARVKVNPFDLQLITEKKAEILMAASSLRDIEILEDPSILGGCIIETDAGQIDATVNTRLEVLEQNYREAA